MLYEWRLHPYGGSRVYSASAGYKTVMYCEDFLQGRVAAAQKLVPRATKLLSSVAASGNMVEYPSWTYGGTHEQKVL